MKRVPWDGSGRRAALLVAISLGALAPAARATIPDADIRDGVSRGGVGVISGAYGQADVPLTAHGAIGGYFGIDPNDLYFGDYGRGDDTFHDDLVVGGHYMHQFLEGTRSDPSISGILGAFANRAGLKPEVGIALSYPFDARWSGRANIVYGPSWGFEMGYRFSPSVEGTFGITGMGLAGLGFRF